MMACIMTLKTLGRYLLAILTLSLCQKVHSQAAFDFFDPDVDLCDNRPNPMDDGRPQLGRCDVGRFPICDEDKEDICYNRKPSRDHFHPLTHQHLYYIQYDRVFCYPLSWGGCSSCTPGRYCLSEKSCVLMEQDYPCEQWF
mmetsp:Transcript_12899/g.23202  ORF Transcript_12899/g.23202 Transcript_12899/m.23202 type:complete len:141 (-) Transcript_12899:83-505(-)